MSNIEYGKKIIEATKLLIEASLKKLKFNQKKKGVIQELNEDGTVDLTINDELYENVKVRVGLSPQINEVVNIEIPNSDYKEMYVDTCSQTTIDDGDTLHSHNNLTLLESITQSLINNWNNAVDHVSDIVKHITSEERATWNTVTDKVDKVSGKQLSTEDYTLLKKLNWKV